MAIRSSTNYIFSTKDKASYYYKKAWLGLIIGGLIAASRPAYGGCEEDLRGCKQALIKEVNNAELFLRMYKDCELTDTSTKTVNLDSNTENFVLVGTLGVLLGIVIGIFVSR